MNAQRFAAMCRFEGGKPGLYFRDHTAGRIKVMGAADDWFTTLIPGHLLGTDSEVVLLSMDNDNEFRVSWGEASSLVSALQQGGWDEVYAVDAALFDARQDLDLDF